MGYYTFFHSHVISHYFVSFGIFNLLERKYFFSWHKCLYISKTKKNFGFSERFVENYKTVKSFVLCEVSLHSSCDNEMKFGIKFVIFLSFRPRQIISKLPKFLENISRLKNCFLISSNFYKILSSSHCLCLNK